MSTYFPPTYFSLTAPLSSRSSGEDEGKKEEGKRTWSRRSRKRIRDMGITIIYLMNAHSTPLSKGEGVNK